jgi:Fur family ferric uptake transcriptional regulator
MQERRYEVLKGSNLRLTRQRKVILDELRRMKSHPSADELYEAVRKSLPRISLGTVYRNLEILCDLGEIQKLELSGSLKRFDGNAMAHYHIRCIRCDCLADLPMETLPDVEARMAGLTDFQVIGHRLEFIGICPQCTAANAHAGIITAR